MNVSFPVTPTQNPEVHQDGDGWKDAGEPGHGKPDNADSMSDTSDGSVTKMT